MKVFLSLVVGTVLAVGACHAASTTDHWTVKVAGGEARGVVKDGIASFKGIPFAAPPVGELRWKSPQPVVPWDGVREADQFGPPPMQPAIAALLFGVRSSEDCLYLNVWTAAKDAGERRPVMVWIYGGAFNGGAANSFDGTNFAKKGVVLVTFNYRIGVFGLLAHPELSAESGKGSGCYGIQDQIAALRWVKENIVQFGGEPNNVTIFGQSAGGISVSILAQSPPARGLFHRAISQSGGSMAPVKTAADQYGVILPSLAVAEQMGKAFVAGLGAADIQAARALSAEVVQKGKVNGLPWPVADGATIVGDNPLDLYERGQFNDTPILVGTNSDDGLFSSKSTPAAFEKLMREQYSLAAEEILAAYPHATKEQATRSSRDVVRDVLFAWPTWAWAKMQSQHGKGEPFLYYFDYGSKPGEASHGAEVRYVFGNLGGLLFRTAKTLENRAMSDTIMSYWVNFAASGNPNGPGLPPWPAFDGETMSAMIFGKTPQAGPTPNIEKLKAFDTYYARLRQQRQK
ncbi:MAG: carboxylesterase family protein [Phycisphaerales bacterium]